MLPEMFWSAKDCACKPATEVFSASKIPITSSPNSIPAANRTENHGRNRRRESQALCQNRKCIYFNDLNRNAPVQGPGHNCRAGNNCRAQIAFSSEVDAGSREENASRQRW